MEVDLLEDALCKKISYHINMSVQLIGLKELKAAVRRNPQRIILEARNFLSRGIAEYKKGIIRNPWKIGGTGGGAPVRTGNLRDTHFTQISRFTAMIGPDKFNRYAKFVHEGTRKMKARPWLEYVKKDKDSAIQKHYSTMLANITHDLAK